MDPSKLYAIVGLLVALSIAAERLVEIVKQAIPWLRTEKKEDPGQESWRRLILQVMAVLAGIGTALLARPSIPTGFLPMGNGIWPIIALGLLASGGSGFWNSVLVYVTKLKELKKLEVDDRNKASMSELSNRRLQPTAPRVGS